ncbi:MAG: hypothetical protein Q8Q86_02420 [Candidatus Daviesbacteria bacterium]|nr:hypothetical protein [Candidatus Daviesbacteria bacterium]
MIARLLISTSKDRLKKEISEILHCNLEGYRTNHPDLLYVKEGDKLGIAEARKIKGHFSLKPYSAKGRVVVLEDAPSLTTEAQNALLKTLEELPKEAILILGANSDANLLPTILSRCQIIHLENSKSRSSRESEFIQDIEILLSAGTEERFRVVEKLKNKEEFLAALLAYFHQDLPKNKEFLTKLLQAEEWAKHNVNIRAILEYLMLVMPQKI